MSRELSITAKQGAAAPMVVMAGAVWIAEIPRWSDGLGKVPSYSSDATVVVCFFGMPVPPIVSTLLALRIASDRRERFTAGLAAAVIHGCKPALLLLLYMLSLG